MIDKIKKLLNIRNLPHPGYGKYLGAKRRCESKDMKKNGGQCPNPVDRLDSLGVWHDLWTSRSGRATDVWADFKLAREAVKLLPKHFFTGYYAQPVYGRLYHLLMIPVMTMVGVIATPFRLSAKGFGK
jgi:hypothetical protein